MKLAYKPRNQLSSRCQFLAVNIFYVYFSPCYIFCLIPLRLDVKSHIVCFSVGKPSFIYSTAPRRCGPIQRSPLSAFAFLSLCPTLFSSEMILMFCWRNIFSIYALPLPMCNSYNFQSLAVHCRPRKLLWLLLNLFWSVTDNTSRVKLAVVQSNKNMEPEEKIICRCPSTREAHCIITVSNWLLGLSAVRVQVSSNLQMTWTRCLCSVTSCLCVS